MFSTDIAQIEQPVGHFVVTFPGAFHQGYNTGDNIFEARNFSSPGWPQWAKNNLGQYCVKRCKDLLVNVRLDELLKKVWPCFMEFEVLVNCDADCKGSQSDPDFIKDGVCVLLDC